MTADIPKQEREQVVFSIYPNSRGFGYAVMTNSLTVLNSQVVHVRPISNIETLKRIRQLIDYYEPKIVIVEDYRGIGSRKSKRIQKIIESIVTYANKKHLAICKYSRADIRYVFSNFNAHTKHEISCVIAENIKNMKHKLYTPRLAHESEKYSAGAFDAVSLGITHFYMAN